MADESVDSLVAKMKQIFGAHTIEYNDSLRDPFPPHFCITLEKGTFETGYSERVDAVFEQANKVCEGHGLGKFNKTVMKKITYYEGDDLLSAAFEKMAAEQAKDVLLR